MHEDAKGCPPPYAAKGEKEQLLYQLSYPGKGVVDGEGGVLRNMETHTTGGSFPGFSRIFSRIFPLRFGRDTAEVACACARANIDKR